MLRTIYFAFLFILTTTLTAQSLTLSGMVKDRFDEPVGSMTIDLLDATGAVIATANVDCDGVYAFTDLEAGVDYSLRPDKPGAWLNGVSTYDLVQTSKHLLGLEVFTDPYQIAAVDLDDSGSVSVLDIVLGRALVLAMIELLPGNSWLFFAEGDTVPALEFPIVLSSDLPDYDLIAIKRGDTNGSSVNCE